MAYKAKKKKFRNKGLPSSSYDDYGSPHNSGANSSYIVDPRFSDGERILVTAVEAIPFVGRGISDIFFGSTKRNEKLDQLAASKVDVRRKELDKLSPRGAYDLGVEFYDNIYADERRKLSHLS